MLTYYGSIMRQINKYKITRFLGRGGTGRVYRVIDTDSKRTGALKIMDPHPHILSLIGKKKVEEIFYTEMELMENISHPNLISIMDKGICQGRPFFVMEYYCYNLADYIGESEAVERPVRTVPPKETLRIVREILNGLKVLHDSEIIHRDIKPSNIMFTENGRVKIIDLGMSKIPNYVWSLPNQIIVGTPYYTSPEQERDSNSVGPASDIFSVGVLIFRLLMGSFPKIPFSGDLPEPFSGPHCKEFFSKILAVLPERRYQKTEEVLEKLQEIENEIESTLNSTCSIWKEWKPRETEKVKCRHHPLIVSEKDAIELFSLDSLMRPLYSTINNWQVIDENLLFDETTGLYWQLYGSSEALTWSEAEGYVARLNDEEFGNRTDWRLPTISELTTIIKKPTFPDTFCMPSVFPSHIRLLWSSDRCSRKSSWYVGTYLGYVGKHYIDCKMNVIAVAGPN